MMRLFALSLLCLLPNLLPALEEGQIRCRFLAFGGTAPPPLLNLSPKGEEVACSVPADNLSKETNCYCNNGAVAFVTAADRKPAATARVPATAKAVILVFVANAKTQGSLPWRVFVVDDSPRGFPDGGVFVANFHQQDIRFLIGEHKILLRPADAHGFARPAERDEFNMAPVIFQFFQDGTWRTASESALRFVPGLRYLIFAYVDPASGRPRLATYQDHRPAPEAPVPAKR